MVARWLHVMTSVCVGASLWHQWPPSAAAGLSLFGESSTTLIDAPIDALLQRLPLVGRISGMSSAWSSADQALHDLRVSNLSVHRVQFEGRDGDSATLDPDTTNTGEDEANVPNVARVEETMIRSLFGSAWASMRKGAGGKRPISSVVVTWEDHEIAAESRPDSEDDDQTCTGTSETSCTLPPKSSESDRQVTYEVQVWVNGWGFDAFWHPANRKLSTRDPFVVLTELPPEQELKFRVRMKVRTKTGMLSGFFATEVEGPWCDPVALSPSKQHIVDTIIQIFATNKAVSAVVVVLIGVSVLIILKLVLCGTGRRSRAVAGPRDDTDVFSERAVSSTQPRRRRRPVSTDDHLDLEQEVADLRQELADSEAEVRRLMLFRGYGIDALDLLELDELEAELRRTLKLVLKRKRVSSSSGGLASFESLDETEEEEEDDTSEPRDVDVIRNGSSSLDTVFEGEDESSGRR